MNKKYLQIIQIKLHDQYELLKKKVIEFTEEVKAWIQKYWFRVIMLGILLWTLAIKDVSVNLNLQSIQENTTQNQQINNAVTSSFHPKQTSFTKKKKGKTERVNQPRKDNARSVLTSKGNEMNTYSNLPFNGSSKKLSESAKKRAAKKKKQLAYVKKYKKMAQKEMNIYGIPVSIILAQGLLESNVGASRLARKNNNHFGMKCFSKRCRKGHCSNFTDDSHKDFFRKYRSVADSYRAHSKLLKNAKRYRSLFKLDKTNYKGWAKGLKKAGYATDKRYDTKLIRLIEDLRLDKLDR